MARKTKAEKCYDLIQSGEFFFDCNEGQLALWDDGEHYHIDLTKLTPEMLKKLM